MADGIFNVARGRLVELYYRVRNNDPTNSVFLAVLCTDTISDSVLVRSRNLDELFTVPEWSDNISESSDAAYSRKSIHGGSSPALAAFPNPDDGNDRYLLNFPTQTWTGLDDGELITRGLICYNPDSSSSDDSTIIPCLYYDINQTTDGTPFVWQFPTPSFIST